MCWRLFVRMASRAWIGQDCSCLAFHEALLLGAGGFSRLFACPGRFPPPVGRVTCRGGPAPPNHLIWSTDMTKRLSAKHKIDRRLGENLWGRPKSPLNKREYGPGQHGQRRKKPTDFGTQLMAKQKLKGYYGNIGESQFRKIYDEAVRRQGRHLREPDRAAGAPARRGHLSHEVRRHPFRRPPVRQPRPHLGQRQAREHPELPCKDNDVIEVREKSKQLALVLEATQSPERDVPDYLEVDHREMKGRISRVPQVVGRALSGRDGAEPRGRVLLALSRAGGRIFLAIRHSNRAPACL